MLMLTTFNAFSDNRKTGKIPATRTERASCPITCPLFLGGCYAQYGNEKLHWERMHNALTWSELCAQIRRLPVHQLWRHNTSGDLPHSNGLIDAEKVKQLTAANRRKRGFTFTHHSIVEHNLEIIKFANNGGFTVNVSTQSVETADRIMTEHGIPAVAIVLSSETRRFFRTDSGRRVIICPATIHEGVNCSTCGLCQRRDRDFIVGFPAHGAGKKKVDKIVMAA